MTPQPLLELHLHLVNGNTHKFVQNDPALVQELLHQINIKVFTQPTLLFAGQDLVTAYPGSALICISLLMERPPDELLYLGHTGPGDGLLLSEIDQATYHARRHTLARIVEGQPFVGLSEVQFTTGHRLWLEAHVPQAGSGLQERWILQHLFSRPAFSCRRADGGINVWNQAHVVSYSICPQPAVPTTAWPAELLTTD